jgi:TonB family protein
MKAVRRVVLQLGVLVLVAFENVVAAPSSQPAIYAPFAPPPDYPYMARLHHIEGSGVFLVHIRPDGKVSSVDVAQSSGSKVLDSAALMALRKWRFRPGPTEAKIPIMWKWTGRYK